ncbi:hypothetical protein WJX84_012305 [Apatococcus fuscideae]|uniref:Uncharacterized protein n=1 Tax=Apatococcus fuscideae TaxID=2026836 RepID=A0AAW1TGK7_9CHLO
MDGPRGSGWDQPGPSNFGSRPEGTEHGDEGRGSGSIPPGPPGGGFMGRNWNGQSSGGGRPERDRDLMMGGMHIDPPMDPMMLPMSGMMDGNMGMGPGGMMGGMRPMGMGMGDFGMPPSGHDMGNGPRPPLPHFPPGMMGPQA